MSRDPRHWTPDEERRLAKLVADGKDIRQMSRTLGKSYDAVRHKLRRGRLAVPQSDMPIYNQPLRTQGDFVVMSDVEAPYQNSDFMNRVLDLADAWGIPTLHLAGDLLHYDNLSAWGSEWTENVEELGEKILDFVQSLKGKARADGVRLIEESGLLPQSGGLSAELKAARKVFKSFDQFDTICVELGNHDDRYIRALDQALEPTELLHQIDAHNNPRFKIAAYYYAIAETESGEWRITHPRGAGRTTAQDLAVQFHQHVIMGHSHRWNISLDPSGKFWAIQTGCCVDERRLAYVMQRDSKRDAHMPGATIVRGGYPFVLRPDSPWDMLKGM